MSYMAEVIQFETKNRSEYGKQATRKLRRQGLCPVVLYGHGEGTLTLSLPSSDLEKAIRHGSRVVDLKADGKVQKALIRDVQWDFLGKEIVHVDFYRISADERVVVTVPIEIRGTAPGIAAGGILDQPIHTLSVECLAVSVPGSIRVNVSALQLGNVIHVKDLTLPDGVIAKQDPEAVVVQVTQREDEEAAEPGMAEGPVEPEVIGRKAAEEEEAE